ncbi:MAG: hypothetical protein EBR82_45850 [Caulobacteraceae bacterium]|nr:hypothetical protein [Caulobacteraceae bacterium]
MQLEMFTAAARPPKARRRQAEVSATVLFAAWADNTLTFAEVARRLGVTDKQLYALARKHALPKRPSMFRSSGADDCPDAWGEPEAEETCDLSPWVKARIRELNLAGEWTQASRFA